MSKNRTLAEEWSELRANVLPVNASPVQISETRRAFYAGACSLMNLVLTNLTDDAEPTEEDLKYMDSLQTEIETFSASIGKGT